MLAIYSLNIYQIVFIFTFLFFVFGFFDCLSPFQIVPLFFFIFTLSYFTFLLFGHRLIYNCPCPISPTFFLFFVSLSFTFAICIRSRVRSARRSNSPLLSFVVLSVLCSTLRTFCPSILLLVCFFFIFLFVDFLSMSSHLLSFFNSPNHFPLFLCSSPFL